MASRRATTTATGDNPVAQLAALHRQCSQQARQEDRFDVGGKTVFLDLWGAGSRPVGVGPTGVDACVPRPASLLRGAPGTLGGSEPNTIEVY